MTPDRIDLNQSVAACALGGHDADRTKHYWKDVERFLSGTLRTTAAYLAVVTLAIWTAFVIMRVPLLSHFHKVAGDALDGMLALAIEMHWYHVFNWTAIGWRTTNYFFPIRDTLGYNEGFFLNGALLALLRACGIDAFLGLQLVDWCFRAIGFISMWTLARRCFNWPLLVNVLAATLFVTANCYYSHDALHAQFLVCNWLPLLILLQVESLRAAGRAAIRRFIGFAAAFAGLLGAILITAFYVAFFFILADLLVLVLLVVLEYFATPLPVLPAIRRYMLFAAVQILFLVVCCVPFLMIYLPKAAETGMHPISDVLQYALRPTDVINVGPSNLLWSYFYSRTLWHLFPNWAGSYENQTGATPILFALFLFGGFFLRSTRTLGWPRAGLFAMWCANLLLLVAAIRWPHWGCPWAWIYRWVPGAAAVRVVSRIQLVLLIPTILVACDVIAQGWRRTEMQMVFVLLACLLLVEQINNAPVFDIDRPAENAFFASVDHVPPACRAFFAQNSRPGPDFQSLYRHNVDSMILAELSGTPTLNGFTTFLPPHWNLVHPEQPQYLTAVRDWLARHPVRGPICGVNFRTGAWTVLPSAAVK